MRGREKVMAYLVSVVRSQFSTIAICGRDLPI